MHVRKQHQIGFKFCKKKLWKITQEQSQNSGDVVAQWLSSQFPGWEQSLPK
jgi:hypothetical protein